MTSRMINLVIHTNTADNVNGQDTEQRASSPAEPVTKGPTDSNQDVTQPHRQPNARNNSSTNIRAKQNKTNLPTMTFSRDLSPRNTDRD